MSSSLPTQREPTTILGYRAELILHTENGGEVRISNFLRWDPNRDGFRIDMDTVVKALAPCPTCGKKP